MSVLKRDLVPKNWSHIKVVPYLGKRVLCLYLYVYDKKKFTGNEK